jgi:hypothetical protein
LVTILALCFEGIFRVIVSIHGGSKRHIFII